MACITELIIRLDDLKESGTAIEAITAYPEGKADINVKARYAHYKKLAEKY